MSNPGGSKKFIVGGIVMTMCVAALLYGATMLMSLDFFDSVSQFQKKLDTYNGGAVRVRGIIEPGSVEHDKTTLDTEFVLKDDEASLPVYYKGILPANFEPGSDLVVQGKYHPERKVLVASQLMFKCPSKYESKRGEYGSE
ncbi:MAG: cytochrome c maturation protein CcmE [Planctomycetes bacterium]|nr:cytochrome c maturation protein CcmE [Planctomycetota bacterium]